ncbi:uncharacterized protein BP01DRAFT_358324 [Aspergillus saccharolyticus JOP 1030-1]|uniref:DUF7514 domain-containing protein n=1 Tax=Aspergillus saccharolyticus JOP 1030-1 TaxID=1450539 RepID=A0A318ZU41_9EURO|nr:hypothetical protein BP01DRAFT_358324 [Aspergillus saccharolyticus JOP 1030-1]PYH43608.1 hypothetical protein BP01DRAFT_358324 [Aspergillus saccharolyticus JOP 1030-1]
MFSAHDPGASFWGVLINSDKSPAPLLEQLCLEIAHIISSFDDYATTDLTPERLATFYRKVGGNYDVLFLQTKPSALSFIYQRLGCFHSIQPTTDAYKPPAIPALQPNGFVRWQTIQLLLDPDEHCRYLQNAVDIWEIENPNGGTFPKTIPREAFPESPDREMVEWHETVSRRFEMDYVKKNILRASPPNFGTYHYHFSHHQKDEPGGSKETNTFPSRRRTTAQRAHVTPDEPAPSSRHQRRRSAEFPNSSTRRVQSTYFRPPPPPPPPPPEFAPSPRAPSPPMWTKSSPKARGRERGPTVSRPVSPTTVPGHNSSDASSEDSIAAAQEAANRHNSRHLRPTHSHSNHARRHSHEAYARKPQRDLSPEAQRRTYTHRDMFNSHSGRPYDSDGGRRTRPARAYAEEPIMHPRTPGPMFHEHAFNDPPVMPHNQDLPRYSHPHSHAHPPPPPRYVNMNINNPYVGRPHPDIDMCAGVDDHRRSYRVPNANSGYPSPGVSGRTARYPPREGEGTYRSPRWANPVPPPARGIPVGMPDMEYPMRSRRSMYDR